MTWHYHRNQPRVPAGHHDGGQWTDGESASESILRSPFLNRGHLFEAILRRHDTDRDKATTAASVDVLTRPQSRMQT